jgi:hypothetical protein
MGNLRYLIEERMLQQHYSQTKMSQIMVEVLEVVLYVVGAEDVDVLLVVLDYHLK